MRARTTIPTMHGPTYGLPAGTLVEVEPAYELPWFTGVRYRVTAIHSDHQAMRELMHHDGVILEAHMVEAV